MKIKAGVILSVPPCSSCQLLLGQTFSLECIGCFKTDVRIIAEMFNFYFAGFTLSMSVFFLLLNHLAKIHGHILHFCILDNTFVFQSEK